MYNERMDEKTRINMWLPIDLRRTLTEIARREQRSLSGQIIVMLRRALEQEQPPIQARNQQAMDESTQTASRR